MDMIVVAEGVETEEQWNLLKEYSVDQIQGNLISLPVAPREIETLILGPSAHASANVVQLRSS
jgi:EAL domain-containing protein (putative c-di-GMP-specific phosphodiesterase class I)